MEDKKMKENLLENLTAAQKQKLSDVWDYLEQNDFIDVDNCTDDTLALRNIDENLVEELKAMFGKSIVISHFASFLETHTFETLMNLGLFKDTHIKSVNIPNSVVAIGNEAFSNCYSLTSVTIPNSVASIGDYAFSNCYSLASVNIPNSVASIGDGAFSDCHSLTSVTIPNSVASISIWTFSDCRVLTSINIPNSVTSIGDYAFSDCNSLTSIDIPNSVVAIGNEAFSNCYSLTSVTIPNSVTSIDDYAFSYCYSLESIILEKGISKSVEDKLRKEHGTKVKLQESLEESKEKSKLKSAGVYSVLKKKWIKEPTQEEIPDIDEEAFEKLYKEWEDRYFDLIDEVADDKESLTENLIAVQKQKLSDVWDYLEQNDFIDVDNCTDDALALRNIDENLVEELQAMLSKAPATLKHLASFLEAHTFETLMNLGLFEGAGIKSIAIPNSVASIGDGAFSDCRSLASVIIPNSVTSIGDDAFYACDSLKSIILEKGISKSVEDKLRKEYKYKKI